jgi:hypothetical protein
VLSRLLLNLAFLYVDKEQNAKIPDHTQCEEKIKRGRGVVVRGSDNGPGNEEAYERRCCANNSEGEEENFFPSERELRQLPEPEISGALVLDIPAKYVRVCFSLKMWLPAL